MAPVGELVDISVQVEIIHSWIGDLKVTLVAPDGTEIVLHNHEGADGDDISATYTSATSPELTTLDGGAIQGAWSLVVVDTASQDVGRLVRWGLVIGYQKSSNTVIGSADPDMAIPDADPQGIVSGIQIQQSGTVKDIAVGIDIKHTYIGDLRVDLVSPSGQVVRLHDQAGGSADNLKRSYDTTSTSDLGDCLGWSMEGEWQLQVRDLARLDTGTLISWSIRLEY